MQTDVIAELEAAHKAATPGEWVSGPDPTDPRERSDWLISAMKDGELERVVIRQNRPWFWNDPPRRDEADNAFIALAHNHWPALLAVARKAREISLSGMEPDDERLDYYTVQVDKREWKALRAALAALESPEAQG